MCTRMSGRWIVISALVLALLLTLAGGLIQARGQEPSEEEMQSQEEAGVMADVGSRIPIQGRLTDADGSPLSGTYSIRFRLYDAATEGTALCEDTNLVNVEDGLFYSEIWGDCGSDDMNGQQLYLGIKVGTDDEMTDRQAIYPVPYAFSLRPGAVISASRDDVLTVESTGNGDVDAFVAIAGGTGEAITAYSPDSTAVWAYSDNSLAVQGHSYSPNVAGPAIYGCKAADPGTCDAHQVVLISAVQGFSTLGAGVYGQSDENWGVYGLSNSGTGVHGVSSQGYAGFFSGSGDVGQSRTGGGLVKASVYADCRETGSYISRSFNHVHGTITIADGASSGRCTIDFGFRIDDRYFVATALTSDGGGARGISCDWGADNEKLDCFRWDSGGNGANGKLMVLVY